MIRFEIINTHMATKKNNGTKQEEKVTSTLARQEDGTVQITMTIPKELVEKEKEHALAHLIEDLEVPGFRKGKAPKDIALKHIELQRLYDHTLQHLLPSAYTTAAEEYKLKPILSPRFELISIENGEDWQIRAITCELPAVNLGDYKKLVKDNIKTTDIWIPGKDKGKNQPSGGPTREEKEQEVIKTLIEKTEVSIPYLLIEEEINHKLSHLLEQVQKIGLSIEQYLASTGKTVEQVKEEYGKQAEGAIKLELALNKVAEEEKIDVPEEEIDAVISVTGDEKTKETLSSPYQKRLIRGALLRRKALDTLTTLI